MPKNQNTTHPLDAQLPQKRSTTTKPKSSPRRLAANRANAQLSTGPRTEAGKKKSALNAIRHGLLARMTILDYESKANFENVAQHYHTHFQPADNIEANYVDEMASTYWRLLRLRALETRLLNRAVLRETSPDLMDRCLNGLVAAADNGTLELFMRYEAHLTRAHHRAFRMLRDLQKNRAPVTPQLPRVMIEPILPRDPEPKQAPQPAPQPPRIPGITYQPTTNNNQTDPTNEFLMPAFTPAQQPANTPVNPTLKRQPSPSNLLPNKDKAA